MSLFLHVYSVLVYTYTFGVLPKRGAPNPESSPILSCKDTALCQGKKVTPQNSRTFVRFRRFQPSILGTFPHSHLLEEWFPSPETIPPDGRPDSFRWPSRSSRWTKMIPVVLRTRCEVAMWRLKDPSFHRVFHLFSGQFHGKFHVKHDVSLIADRIFLRFLT